MKTHECKYCDKLMSEYRHNKEGERTSKKTQQQCDDQLFCNCHCAGDYKASIATFSASLSRNHAGTSDGVSGRELET